MEISSRSLSNWNKTNDSLNQITITDTEQIDENYSEMQKDNLELRGIVDTLSKQLRNLEKRIEILN